MKRTPLVRKTPLHGGNAPLRRSAIKAKPRPKDQVTDPHERSHVISRDGACIAYLFNPGHVCMDGWGNEHDPHDLPRLTVDHVHDHAGGTLGVRAPCKGCAQGKPQRAFMTAMCGYLNGGGGSPSAGLRAYQRAHLRRLEEEGRL